MPTVVLEALNVGAGFDITSSSSTSYANARAGLDSLDLVVGMASGIYGQDGGGSDWFLDQCFFAFGTGAVIPDDATIESVEFQLITDFSTAGTWDHQVWLRDWGAGDLTAADWVPGATLATLPLLASVPNSAFAAGDPVVFVENGTTFRDNINKTGETRIVVTSSKLAAGTAQGGEYFGTRGPGAVAGSRPILTVTYSVPPPSGNALEVAGVSALEMSGKLSHVVTMSGVGALAMSGSAVGEISHPMIVRPIETSHEVFVDLELDDEGEEPDIPLEPPPEEPHPPEEPGPVYRPRTNVWIQRVVRNVPDVAPYLLEKGRVDMDEWTAASTETRETWGRYKIVVAGKDLTFWRGIPSKVLDYERQEPFSEKTATLLFPQLSRLEAVPDWLKEGPRVDLLQRTVDGNRFKVWEGMGGPIRWTKEGLLLECIGAMWQLDYYVRRALLVEDAVPTDIGIILQDLITPYGRDKGALRLRPLNRLLTGVKVFSQGDWNPQLTGWISDLLHRAQRSDGRQYTIRKEFGRKPRILEKDTTTVHYTIHCGEHGVFDDLQLDYTQAPTTAFGEGIYDNCKWYNAKYPAPAYDIAPVFFGTPIPPGSTAHHDSMLTFERRMVERGRDFDQDGNYDLDEEDEVRRLQEEAGITVDGVIGPQTWAAAFEVGGDAAFLESPFIQALVSKKFTEKWNRDPSGSKTTRNPTFDKNKIRIERHYMFGNHVKKKEAIRSLAIQIERDYPADWYGTITLETDPPEKSRLELMEGRNLLYRGFEGGDLLLHITNVKVIPEQHTILTVDTKARDHVELAAMIQRNRENKNARRQGRERHYRNRSRDVKDDVPVWDCESGAGIIQRQAIYKNLWQVNQIPAGKLGTIARVELETIEDEGTPALMAFGVFDRPVTPAQLLRVAPRGPLQPMLDEDGEEMIFWDSFPDPTKRDDPRRKINNIDGLIVAYGQPEEPGGLWPYRLVDNKPITGKTVEASTWYFESEKSPWLWVAMWVDRGNASDVNYVAGRMYPSNETT